jgi:hypothetical protein
MLGNSTCIVISFSCPIILLWILTNCSILKNLIYLGSLDTGFDASSGVAISSADGYNWKSYIAAL